MGIVNWKGTTVNEKGHIIFGTIKPLEKQMPMGDLISVTH